MDREIESLDWSLIQSFLAVAEEGSLSAAARRLGLSQPTLGRQVRAMEEQLGAELFRRQAKGLSVTELGASMLTAAQDMRSAAARFHLTAAGQEGRAQGTVRITASVATSQWHLPAIIAGIIADEPGVEIELVPSDESRNLLFREADIAVRMFRPTQLDIVTRHIGDLKLGAYAAKGYLASRPPIRGLSDLEGHSWIGYDAQTDIIDGMAAIGIPVDRHFFQTRCDDNAAYIELLRAGCGIGLCQVSIAARCPELVRLPFPVELPVLPVWLAAPEAIRHVPRISRVWDALAKGLAPLVA